MRQARVPHARCSRRLPRAGRRSGTRLKSRGRLGSEPPAPTSGAPLVSYAPPQVVRLDSEAVAHESSEEEDIVRHFTKLQGILTE